MLILQAGDSLSIGTKDFLEQEGKASKKFKSNLREWIKAKNQTVKWFIPRSFQEQRVDRKIDRHIYKKEFEIQRAMMKYVRVNCRRDISTTVKLLFAGSDLSIQEKFNLLRKVIKKSEENSKKWAEVCDIRPWNHKISSLHRRFVLTRSRHKNPIGIRYINERRCGKFEHSSLWLRYMSKSYKVFNCILTTRSNLKFRLRVRDMRHIFRSAWQKGVNQSLHRLENHIRCCWKRRTHDKKATENRHICSLRVLFERRIGAHRLVSGDRESDRRSQKIEGHKKYCTLEAHVNQPHWSTPNRMAFGWVAF